MGCYSMQEGMRSLILLNLHIRPMEKSMSKITMSEHTIRSKADLSSFGTLPESFEGATSSGEPPSSGATGY